MCLVEGRVVSLNAAVAVGQFIQGEDPEPGWKCVAVTFLLQCHSIPISTASLETSWTWWCCLNCRDESLVSHEQCHSHGRLDFNNSREW